MATFQLENFNTKVVSNDPTVAPRTSLEEHTLESFEQGYKAGWDDAIETQKDDQTKISSGFARNLQDLSFTLTEARAQVIKSITPLLKEMVHKVLPKISMAGLSQLVVDQVTEIAKSNADAQIVITVAPKCLPAIEALLGQTNSSEITIIAEPSFAEGLAAIQFADSEIKIDLDGVIQSFESALEQFYSQHEKEAENG